MAAHISIHNTGRIEARTTRTSGAPVVIEFYGGDNNTVTLFVGDQALAEALAEAINAAVAQHEAQRKAEAA